MFLGSSTGLHENYRRTLFEKVFARNVTHQTPKLEFLVRSSRQKAKLLNASGIPVFANGYRVGH